MATAGWKVAAGGAGLGAAALTRRVLARGWRKARGTEPPADLGDPGTPWRDALGWAAVTGVGVTTARLVARRGVAAGWKRAAGTPPPTGRRRPA